MVATPELAHPTRWDDIDLDTVDGLLLPGGHRARGMRPYLESRRLQAVIVDAFRRDLPVAAICHGVLLAARSIDPDTGRSVLHGRKTTSLTWRQERLAAAIGRIVRCWEPGYYRPYPDVPGQPPGHMSVQSEVTRALARPEDFIDVHTADPAARTKSDGRHRDCVGDQRAAHVVQDGNYLSARWPGDAHTFATRYASLLQRITPRDPALPLHPAGLPRPYADRIDAQLAKAFNDVDPRRGLRVATGIAAQLDDHHPSAAASLREGLDDMFTARRLGASDRLARSLSCTSAVESMISVVDRLCGRVTSWRDPKMTRRWAGVGMLEAERSFRRVRGSKDMPALTATHPRPGRLEPRLQRRPRSPTWRRAAVP